MTTASRRAWYVLLDKRGEPYKKTRPTSAIVPLPCITAEFTMIAKTINTNALRQVASSQLRVCSNRSAQYSEQLLKVDADISAFGLSAQDPLVVIVPDLDEPRPNQQRTAFSVYMQPNHYLQQLKEQCTQIGDLPHEGDFLSLFDWKTEDCGKFIDISTINEIVNFKGSKFYLRREILCVLANFKEVFQREFDTGEVGPEQFILLGSPKVGKSCILALISVFIAVVYQRPVVLHRQAPGFLQTITLLLHAGKYYEWVDPDGRYFDVLSGVVIDRKSIWVCLDGMTQGEIAKKDWASEYKLLATCGEFDVKYDGYDNMKRCLVPYWSHSDLEDFARKCLRMQDSDIAFRLYILGGSFDAFNNDDVARRKVTAAIRSINTSDTADCLLSQYRFGSIEKVDHIRMRGVQDRENVENYMDPTKWTCRVSSKYALCHLSAN
ncbi:hypothetical protein LEN26_018823 [Aphanomyces euteiches]|nr:hypothetical protein LEN26_018823 [Aphanomyces euteiches]